MKLTMATTPATFIYWVGVAAIMMIQLGNILSLNNLLRLPILLKGS